MQSSARPDVLPSKVQRHTVGEEVRIAERCLPDPAAERRELIANLLAMPASISPKYFYDATGCALFARICMLPEYYPTRTEAAIFAHHRADIVAAAGTGKQLVDLGAGDCGKGAALLPWLAPTRYVAVDIARNAIADALPRVARAYPDIDVQGVLTDFTRGLDLCEDIEGAPATFFYPGSSIGNFTPAEALQFLQSLRRHCEIDEGSGVLIGVDTKKDPERLRAAYDDAEGVTAAFNRNVLLHVNRILGTRFAPVRFAHVACYDAEAGRIEMHLEARAAQTVRIDGRTRTFDVGERIHTENSFKYDVDEFAAMLGRAGFASVRWWQDDAGDFAVYYAN